MYYIIVTVVIMCVDAQFTCYLSTVSPFIDRKTNNLVTEIQPVLLPSFAYLLLNYVATEPILPLHTEYIIIES